MKGVIILVLGFFIGFAVGDGMLTSQKLKAKATETREFFHDVYKKFTSK